MKNKEEAAILERYKRRKENGRVYSIFAPDEFYAEWMVARELLNQLKRHGILNIRDKKVLDVGCGYGSWLRKFVNFGADPCKLHGIDLLEERVKSAKYVHPNMWFKQCNAEAIPFPDQHFDMVIQAVVFTSILDYATKKRIADEMLRVLNDDGLIIWFDFRYDNPWNPDVKGIGKNDLQSLFTGCTFDFKSVVLAPPITKLLARYSVMACLVLEKIPILRTHYLTIIKKH